jgi:hypothetical protein
MITAFLLAVLLQIGLREDFIELRRYIGMSYRSVIQALNEKNQILLRNTERLAPAQAAEMRIRMKPPDSMPKERPILAAKLDNIGQGLVTFLFEDDFITEEVNFVFCPGEADRPERVVSVQVLLDDSRALQQAVQLLQTTYTLPPPIVPAPDYQLALMYPIRPNLPLTIWNIGPVEVVYQPVTGQPLITGQLWLTDRTIATQCTSIPKL